MKYMGSKRWMLRNGLGELLAREVRGATRFVDLFAGSGAVAAHVATSFQIPVVAFDLQKFSTVLTSAVLARASDIDAETLWRQWHTRAKASRVSLRPPSALKVTRERVDQQRRWCAKQDWQMTRAYGGYYFSGLQAVWLDALRQTLPRHEPGKTVALAALIKAASECAAAPGHTAQPFRPSRKAKPFLKSAWHSDVVAHCKDALSAICKQHAKMIGTARVADANEAAKGVEKGDLVFVDPPYSGVHYSRFYHVLETLARGQCGEVSGAGRYPPTKERPNSRYSVQSKSAEALDELLGSIATRGATAIVTFPKRKCSNGLSGKIVAELGGKHFNVERKEVLSRFSTLGGNNAHRRARRLTHELILVLRARKSPSRRSSARAPKSLAQSSLSASARR